MEDAEEEAGVEEDVEMEEVLAPPPMDDLELSTKRDYRVDLWPHAHGKDFYKKLIGALVPNDIVIAQAIVVTTSAHPSPVPKAKQKHSSP